LSAYVIPDKGRARLHEGMNRNHQQLCTSPEWAAHLAADVLPRLCAEVRLGPELLEIGPGPGAATGWLGAKVRSLVAIEIDPAAAQALRARFAGTNVEVVTGDAAELPWPDESFDTVATCTMLHHVPTQQGQNAVLSEALRVLRPGGSLLASDSLPSSALHDFHDGDTYNPVDPAGLIARLQTVGYGRIIVEVGEGWTARACKPTSGERIR
jgi:SAM-dependent methyltransferase